MSNRIVVYTCITGNYDVLRPIAKKCSGIDYICFTDNPNIRSNDWRILPIPADLRSLNQIKQQRLVKILPNKYLGQYDISIWFDANIQINCNLIADFLSEIPLSSNFIFVKPHPTRTCAYEEAKAVIRMGKDNSDVVSRQMANYYNEGYPTENGLVESNILIRKHNDINCIRLMYTWATEVVKGSFRDQLSFNYACWKNGVIYGRINIEKNKKSDSRFSIFEHGAPLINSIDNNTLLNIGDSELPPVTVIITTHNRTNVACPVIDALVKNLKYPNIKWCISDDRSYVGHIQKLVKRFEKNGIYDVKICTTTKLRYGLGASLNNGLQYAWTNSEIALVMEDDWMLERELDIREYVVLMMSNSVAQIRLAYLDGRHHTKPYTDKLVKVEQSKFNYIFNNQASLKHKRIYDAIGYNKECCSSDEQEEDMRNKYNDLTSFGSSDKYVVLYPSHMKKHTFDDPSLYFIHVGRSTNGHECYQVPERYNWIYFNKKEMPIVLLADDNYVDTTKKTVKQIQNNSGTEVHIIAWNDETASKLKRSFLLNRKVTVHSLAESDKNRCIDVAGDLTSKRGYFVPPIGLVKFLIPKILNNYDNALYLDSDVLILNDLSNLLKINIENYFAGVVIDPGSITLSVPNTLMNNIDTYFNSGVMVMNLKELRDKAVDVILFGVKNALVNEGITGVMDQDALNVVFNKRIFCIDNKYNSLVPIITDLINKKMLTINDINDLYHKHYLSVSDIQNEAVILHCASGSAKPWNKGSPYKKYWDSI